MRNQKPPMKERKKRKTTPKRDERKKRKKDQFWGLFFRRPRGPLPPGSWKAPVLEKILMVSHMRIPLENNPQNGK